MWHRLAELSVIGLAALTLIPTVSAQPASQADAAPNSGDDPEVAKLFKALADDDWKVREDAREQLIARGEDVLPQIRKLAEHTQDPETRAAVAAIAAAIEAGAIDRPTLITLDLTNAPPREIHRQLSTQLSVPLPVWPENALDQGPGDNRKATLSVKRQPFWAAMRDLLPQVAMKLESHGRKRLTLMPGDSEFQGPAHLHGPFMVVAREATATQSVRYRDPAQRTANMTLNLHVFAEPKVTLLGRAWQPTIEEMKDHAGRSLVDHLPADYKPGKSRSEMHPHAADPTFQLSLPIPADALSPAAGNDPRKISKLKGHVRVLLETRGERVEVPNVTTADAKGKKYSKAGWHVTVNDASEAGGGYTLNLTVSRDVIRNLLENFRGGDQWQDRFDGSDLVLVDAEGRALSSQGYSINGSNRTWRCDMRYRRGAGVGPPTKLVWEFPVEAKEVQVPFEFKDLPLP